MPKTQTAPTKAALPRTPRKGRTASKKADCVPSVQSHIPEFDAAARHHEIAQVAYRNWLERSGGPGSAEEDWLKAEMEVRAIYARQVS